VAGFCKYGDEPAGYGATELVQLITVSKCFALHYVMPTRIILTVDNDR
jgi:hypothetical protein